MAMATSLFVQSWTLRVKAHLWVEARGNLKEALELFFETASTTEIQQRLHEEVYVTRVEVEVA